MVLVDEAWGGHLHFHPAAAAERDGGRRRRLRAVHPQAGRRPAADRPHPLARGPRRLRAHGGGLPRVRDDLAQLPPAGLRRRGRAHAGGAGRARRSARRSRARTSSRRGCARALPDLDHLDEPAWLARWSTHVAGHDLVKTTVGLSRYAAVGLRGRSTRSSSAGSSSRRPACTRSRSSRPSSSRRTPWTTRSAALVDVLGGRGAPGRRARADGRQPVQRDRRPAGDAPLRGAPLREVDRPRAAAARGGRQGRRRARRGLSARHPADPRGLPRERRRRRLPARGARQGRLDRRRATRACRRCGSSEPR